MKTIYLIYPSGPKISCPDALGRNVSRFLSKKYHVKQYNWYDPVVIKPTDGDILLGHPAFAPYTCFRESIKQPGWRRILAISPYTHGSLYYLAFFDQIIKRCDLFLSITGNYWFSTINTSHFSHWLPKMVHLDLAVDRKDFPVIKKIFNKPGMRRFLYIGNTAWYKNTAYLTLISKIIMDADISWIGSGERTIEGLKPLGYQDFATADVKELVSQHDFLITVGNADPNPTTILEAMAWGLIPVCTPQSGYVNYPGIVNIPLGNAQKAAEILRSLQDMPESQLKEMQEINWHALDTHFNWERFTNQIINAIESDASPRLKPVPLSRKLRIFLAASISPHSFLRPRAFLRSLKSRKQLTTIESNKSIDS